MRAGLQFVLAIHHDALAGFETFVNQRLAVFDLRDLHWAHLDRLVVLDDKRERALRPALNHRRRHDEPALARGEQQAGVDELARPEAEIVVRKVALSLMVPVVVSIWLSMTASLPSPSTVVLSRSTASTVRSPAHLLVDARRAFVPAA